MNNLKTLRVLSYYLLSLFGNRKRAAWLGGALCLLFVGPAVSSAQAASPWWQFSSGTRPTYLQPGQAKNEVQKPTVNGPVGETYYLFSHFSPKEVEEIVNGEIEFPPFAELQVGADAATVQAGLEGIYGAGNVAVAALPGGAPGDESFEVSFEGELADQPVGTINTELNHEFGSSAVLEVTELAQGRPDGEVVLGAENLGDATLSATKAPVKITDVLPEGLEALGITAIGPGPEGGFNFRPFFPCSLVTLTCTFSESLAPYQQLEVRIAVRVKAGAQSGEVNKANISGGGAPAASVSRPLTFKSEATPFGVEDYVLRAEEEGGAAATRAGSHPFQVTGVVTVNQAADDHSINEVPEVEPAFAPKDILTKLPPGLTGNPTVTQTCSLSQFLTKTGTFGEANLCPPDTAVGVSSATVNNPGFIATGAFTQPVFNLEAAPGEPARFGFFIATANVPVILDTSVRTASDYGIDVNATNISQTAGLTSARVTFWGTPGDSRHDQSRGWGCLEESFGASLHAPCIHTEAAKPPPFLALPTACTGSPLATSVQADSWVERVLREYPASEPATTLDGCNQVPFSPTIDAEPTSNAATSPTGLSFDLNVSDEGLANSEGLVQSQTKKAVVTLPEGFTTNPSVAEGLKACSEAAYEASTDQPGTGCPEESKIGDVEVESPLVAQKLQGSLFVAQQGQNPNHNLLTIYMVVQSPLYGVLIKSAGEVKPNPVTGQLVTTFDEIPQLPFSHFHLSFRQGQRSPLVTPPTCGNYTVTADLYPYSNPSTPVHRESSFAITQGPEGGPCPSGTPPFHPNLLAGSVNPTAGTYSPFYTEITRKDSEQEITRFSIKLPPGVIGKLAGVSSCSDAQIAAAKAREKEGGGQEELNSPSCPANSEVGHSLVGAGVGNVLAYAPGKLYLAGPYHGSQLSLVSITAAKVGPFDLGTVEVRFALKIDPETAEVSVDGVGSDPIPHIIDGIPLHLRDIQAFVDRPDFTLNPTSCAKTSTASTVLGSDLNFASSADDQPVTISSPYQVGSCASLGFKPKLKLSLKGGTKRNAVPRFKAVVTYPKKGAYANIAKTQVTLPSSEFLEQGHIGTVCTRVQFAEGNTPGEKCPAASVYGRASAITPLLDEPIAGPVYLRANGGERQLPDLVAALHNGQINIDLVGFIDSVHKKGSEVSRIRNTFAAVPDAPVSKFILEMAGGKKGLLVNSTNICKGSHRANANFTAHNGKVHNFTPPLTATACPKKGKKAHKHRSARK